MPKIDVAYEREREASSFARRKKEHGARAAESTRKLGGMKRGSAGGYRVMFGRAFRLALCVFVFFWGYLHPYFIFLNIYSSIIREACYFGCDFGEFQINVFIYLIVISYILT